MKIQLSAVVTNSSVVTITIHVSYTTYVNTILNRNLLEFSLFKGQKRISSFSP